MPSGFILVEVLGWSIFSILFAVATLRIAWIYKGENRLWRRPERALHMQDAGDIKLDKILLGSLSPRKKLFR